MRRARTIVSRFLRAEHAQDLLEYAMLAALIAVVAVGAVTSLGQSIQQMLWQHIVNNF